MHTAGYETCNIFHHGDWDGEIIISNESKDFDEVVELGADRGRIKVNIADLEAFLHDRKCSQLQQWLEDHSGDERVVDQLHAAVEQIKKTLPEEPTEEEQE